MNAAPPEDRLILVVDDDPDILQTLALCLSTEGYRVATASNGKEALAQVVQERPAAVLLDLMMPVMDGWQFVAELDAKGLRPMPILILSADRAVQLHAAKLRANGHLAKPFDLEELLGKVQELTGGPHDGGKRATA